MNNNIARQSIARFSLKLFILVCMLLSLLIAWVAINQKMKPQVFVGFPADGPRQVAFVAPGQLSHSITHTEINRETGEHLRVTIRIQLNHDRVLSHSIQDCLASFEHTSTDLHSALKNGDPSHIESYAKLRLTIHNGTSAIRSVKVTDFKFFRPSVASPGDESTPTSQIATSKSTADDEPSDARETSAASVLKSESTSRSP